MEEKKNGAAVLAIAGIAAMLLILVLGTIWIGQRAGRDSKDVARTVSLLYLDELAGRREQVVADNLKGRTQDMLTALELMTAEDTSDIEHLQAYQAKMKRLFRLERFAFVDTKGLIYTSTGTQTDLDDYNFDPYTLTEPEISIKDLNTFDKKVIIATPVDSIPFNGGELIVCFMQIDMNEMLSGVSCSLCLLSLYCSVCLRCCLCRTGRIPPCG